MMTIARTHVRIPITDTVTPMPEVKLPKQSDNNNSGTNKKEE